MVLYPSCTNDDDGLDNDSKYSSSYSSWFICIDVDDEDSDELTGVQKVYPSMTAWLRLGGGGVLGAPIVL